MDTSITNPSTWQQIELAESYLVCSMLDEALSLSSSIIKQLRDDDETYGNELDDMLESAAMVLVQSLKGLKRTSEIMNELKLLFGSVASIPVQVFITGTCFQISENSYSNVQEFLEEYLSKWRYSNEGYYISTEDDTTDIKRSGNKSSLEIDKYSEVLELYLVTFLATVKNDVDLAISWAEKVTLPVVMQQDLLRRLQSINSSKFTSSTQESSQVNEDKKGSSLTKDEVAYDGSLEEAKFLTDQEKTAKEAILKFSSQKGRCFWWFRTITLKFGDNRFVISNGNILLGCLTLLIYYVIRRKKVNLTRFVKKQMLTMKKAIGDLWQLAFSYQVNPLAAVQFPSAGTNGS